MTRPENSQLIPAPFLNASDPRTLKAPLLPNLSEADQLAVNEWFEIYQIAEPGIEGGAKLQRLTERDVQVIRFLLLCGVKKRVVSQLVKCSYYTIKAIYECKTWQKLPYLRPLTISEDQALQASI